MEEAGDAEYIQNNLMPFSQTSVISDVTYFFFRQTRRIEQTSSHFVSNISVHLINVCLIHVQFYA